MYWHLLNTFRSFSLSWVYLLQFKQITHTSSYLQINVLYYRHHTNTQNDKPLNHYISSTNPHYLALPTHLSSQIFFPCILGSAASVPVVHVDMIASRNCSIFLLCTFFSSSTRSLRCSIGFRSGDWGVPWTLFEMIFCDIIMQKVDDTRW